MSDTEELRRFFLFLLRASKAVEEFMSQLVPKPSIDALTRDLYKRIYTFSVKDEDVEEMKKALKENGFENLINELSNTGRKLLLGFLFYYGEDGEAVYKAYERALRLNDCRNLVVEDFSTDSLTVSYLIEKHKPQEIKVLTLRRKNRDPGIYTYEVSLQPTNAEEAPEAVRASLDGSLNIDHLLEGLRVFAPGVTLEVVECDPGGSAPSFCTDKLFEMVEREFRERCASN
ncbi:MAG: hypothetical protein ABWK01_03405 [Infirmifilum sp.]